MLDVALEITPLPFKDFLELQRNGEIDSKQVEILCFDWTYHNCLNEYKYIPPPDIIPQYIITYRG